MRRASLLLVVFLAVPAFAQESPFQSFSSGISKALADSFYCKLVGCTIQAASGNSIFTVKQKTAADRAVLQLLSSDDLSFLTIARDADGIYRFADSDNGTFMQFNSALGSLSLPSGFIGATTSGVNIAASDLTIGGGISTGNAVPSAIQLRTTTAGASGSLAQALATRLTVASGGVTSTVPILLPDGTAAAPSLDFGTEGFYSTGAGALDAAFSGTRRHSFQSDAYYLMNDAGKIVLGSAFDTVLSRVSAGVVGTKAGGGTEVANVGGVIDANTTQVGTTAVTTEETLWSYVVPANTLHANGATLRVTINGKFGATANTKTLRTKFGATTLSTEVSTSNGGSFRIVYDVTRSAAGAQTISIVSIVGGAISSNASVTTAEVDTAAITLAFTAQNTTAAANDTVKYRGLVEYFP